MNKLILEGKEYTLSDELIEKIKAEVKEQECSFFERKKGNEYFYIGYDGIVHVTKEDLVSVDDKIYKVGNYCNNREILEQRALRETLNRLLWRYSIEHDGEIKTYGINTLYHIEYKIPDHTFITSWSNPRITEGVVYFKKEETAQKAIEEVIKPFLENHPEFNYFNW